LTGGYMTWLSYSSLDRYKSQKSVYDKEYWYDKNSNSWKSKLWYNWKL
jgi:hypothetical protein